METRTASVNEQESKLMKQLVKDWIDYVEDLMEDFPKLEDELFIARGLMDKIEGKPEDDFKFKEVDVPTIKSRFDLRETRNGQDVNDAEFRAAILSETDSRIGQAGCTSGDCD